MHIPLSVVDGTNQTITSYYLLINLLIDNHLALAFCGNINHNCIYFLFKK